MLLLLVLSGGYNSNQIAWKLTNKVDKIRITTIKYSKIQIPMLMDLLFSSLSWVSVTVSEAHEIDKQ